MFGDEHMCVREKTKQPRNRRDKKKLRQRKKKRRKGDEGGMEGTREEWGRGGRGRGQHQLPRDSPNGEFIIRR